MGSSRHRRGYSLDLICLANRWHAEILHCAIFDIRGIVNNASTSKSIKSMDASHSTSLFWSLRRWLRMLVHTEADRGDITMLLL